MFHSFFWGLNLILILLWRINLIKKLRSTCNSEIHLSSFQHSIVVGQLLLIESFIPFSICSQWNHHWEGKKYLGVLPLYQNWAQLRIFHLKNSRKLAWYSGYSYKLGSDRPSFKSPLCHGRSQNGLGYIPEVISLCRQQCCQLGPPLALIRTLPLPTGTWQP